jgi:bifunctional non-homologous end joining protein LigD
MPGFVEPCHPKIGSPPQTGEWAHEIKFDGYRAQPHIRAGRVTVFTRRGFDWTDRFSSVATSLASLRLKDAILDGEIVVPDANGIPDFHHLEADLAAGRHDRMIFYAFDLLYHNGYDLRGAPLRERRGALETLVGEGSERIRLSENLHPEGSTMLELACRMKLEGIVSKRLDAPYRSGEQDSWLKQKCKQSDNFPIIAFVEKLDAKPRRIASLYLGRWVDNKLLYAGKAQTGFKTEDLYRVRERLDRHIIKACPLSVPIKKPKATWVDPIVQAEIEYSTFTSGGRLRAPVFKGLRDDLDGAPPAKPMRQRRSHGSPSVPRENILQLLPDADPPSSEALIAYWKRVHKCALPYLTHRPLKLVRHVRGTTFYHKGPLPPIPGEVRQLKVQKRSGGEGTRLWIEDLDGLIGLVKLGAIELHPWNARVDDIEQADTMVFDLDPSEGVSWTFVVDAAITLRELLEQEGFESWPKLSGGKGIHLMVPLTETMTHDAAHRRSRIIAERLTETDPDRFTVSAAFAQRSNRLFVDYLRNGRGTTAVGAYSPRARPGHPIAAPVTWADIEAGVRSGAFTMQRLPPVRRR